MTVEEKIDLLTQKLEEKKTRDFWDKAQVIVPIFTGIIALALTATNLWVTKQISDQTRQQAKEFHDDQVMEQRRDSMRKERDELIQEIALLPNITQMMTSGDPRVKIISNSILHRLKENSLFSNRPITYLSDLATEEKASSSSGNTPVIANAGKLISSYWVYLGEIKDNKWRQHFFKMTGMPAILSVIECFDDVYKHDIKPTKISEPDDWDFGNKVGIVRTGDKVKVLDTLTIEGKYVWAQVSKNG